MFCFKYTKFKSISRKISLSYVSGFSSFELAIVLIVLGVLAVISVNIFSHRIDDSHLRAVSIQANAFARTVDALHAGVVATSGNSLTLDDGITVFVNEFGWPAHTLLGKTPQSKFQTAEKCLSLWEGLFSHAHLRAANLQSKHRPIRVELKNSRICRYKLGRKQEESHFIDYDISTGRVSWMTQEDQ
ncbi:MAG: MSHA pilin protein MshB [Flavobacteriales bacterium]